jgi:glyoxylase-like metal-dependent hydrolase (beta-lactamase superfamily II)
VFRLRSFSVGAYDNNVYLLSDDKSGEALLIDPADEAPRIIQELDGLRLSHILVTHWHPDHVQALEAVREKTGAQFACHPLDEPRMPLSADQRLQDGQRLSFGDYELVALHTPGHTQGSVCFLAGERLFTGDTLFPGGPGNTSGPDASFPTIIESLESKLFSLPDEIQVLPGHGKPTTIGQERPHLEEWIARGW